MRFNSKSDTWLAWILLGAVGIQIIYAVSLLVFALPGRWFISPLMALSAGLILWIWTSTYYVVEQGQLRVYCGPFRQSISLSQISSVEPTRSALSSPALSLDRLEIRYGSGRTCMVSPKDKLGFVDSLRQLGVRVQ